MPAPLLALLLADSVVLVLPPSPDGDGHALSGLRWAASVAASVQVPADPCGDAEVRELPAAGGAVELRVWTSLALRPAEGPPAALLEGLALEVGAEGQGEQTLRPAVVLRQRGPVDLQAWLLYPSYTVHEPDGATRSLVFSTEEALGGAFTLGEGPTLETGTWRLRGRRLSLRGEEGRWTHTRLQHEDGGPTEVQGVPLDDTFPQLWFSWGDAVVVSQALTAC